MKAALSDHVTLKVGVPLLQGVEGDNGVEQDASITPSTPPKGRGILSQCSLFITDTTATTGVSPSSYIYIYDCVIQRLGT